MTTSIANGGAVVNGGGGGEPTGAAGGDLGGSYPDPTVTSGTNHTHTSTQISDSTATGRSLVTAATAAAARTTLGTFGVTTYTGADFTAEAGNETAVKAGSGASTTITLTASSTSRAYGTGGATAARAVLPIPAGARDIIVTIKVTAASGLTTGGFRWLGIGLRNAADGGAPTRLWGVGLSDATTYGVGDLMGGANGAGASTGITGVGLGSADRWYSLTFQHRMHFAGILGATGSGTPTAWATVANVVSATTAGVLARADTVAGANALAIWLQSFGGGGATSITFTASVEVVTGP